MHSRVSAFTLIEVMLALALVGLALALVVRITRYDLTLESSFRSRELSQIRQHAFCDRLTRDLDASLRPGELEPVKTSGGDVLSLRTISSSHGTTGIPKLPVRAIYTAERTDNGLRILRRQQALTAEDAPVETAVLLTGLEEFSCRILDAKGWHEATEVKAPVSAVETVLKVRGQPESVRRYIIGRRAAR